jgi:ABC-type lipoprotein export system ATPase subunit
MLELANVSKLYPFEGGSLQVLDNISLTVEPAQSVAIMGPSGSGKTTLLNMIGGLDRPDAGKVMLNRKNLAVLRPGELARVRNTMIGFVFQLHYLLPQCTVLENVLLPTLAMPMLGMEKQHLRKRAMDLLDRTGIRDLANRLPGQLSGGQRQRAALVRALVNQPNVVLADEPTGAVDAKTAEQIIELLLDLNKNEGAALVIATHSERIAQKAQRRFTLDSGVLTEIK